VVELPALITPNRAHQDIFKYAHITLNFVMAGLVTIHILAALWHQFIRRDGLIKRMLIQRQRGQFS
jgi:cytochrome b561